MKIRSRAFVCLLIAVVMPNLGAPAAAQAKWRTYQADPTHVGAVNVAIDPGSVKLRWDALIHADSVLQQVAAADGKVFVTSPGYFGTQGVYALDAQSGDPLWDVQLTDVFSVNPPAWDAGRVYFQSCNHSSDTWLWCYDTSGGLQFKKGTSAQWESYLAPTLYGGVAYINGGYYGGMYAIDAVTGLQQWWNGLAQYDEWTPAVDEDHVYAYVGGLLSVFHRVSGTLDFSVPDPNFDWQGWSMQLAPILGGQDDVIVIHDGRLLSFDLQQHDIRWEKAESFSGQPAVVDGIIYAINDGSLHARDQATGNFLWNWSPVAGTLSGNVVATASHVIASTSTTVHFIGRASHQSEKSYPAAGQLAVDNLNVYVSGSNGHLTALEYQTVPKPQAVLPKKAEFTQAMPTVTITGTGFDEALPLGVSFGGQAASNVQIIDPQTLTCVPPPGPPGIVDVTLVNDKGTGVLPGGFSYIPLVAVSGSQVPAGDVAIKVECSIGDQIVMLDSTAVVPPITVPPFQGTLCFGQFSRLLSIGSWPFESFVLSADIPDDPAFIGLTLYVQALVGPHIGLGQAAFTNCGVVSIHAP